MLCRPHFSQSPMLAELEELLIAAIGTEKKATAIPR